jgi:thioredoxin 1
MPHTHPITDSTFQVEIEGREELSLVDFWAPWCGPCRAIAPVVDHLAERYAGRVLVGTLNVDENASTAARFGVRSIPTLLFFRDGRVVDSVFGAVPAAELAARIEIHLEESAQSRTPRRGRATKFDR